MKDYLNISAKFWLFVGGLLVLAATAYLAIFTFEISSSSGTDIEFDGRLTMADNQFQVDGTIRNSPKSETEIGNISVYVYSDEGTLIKQHPIGALNSKVNVSITVSSPPKYVIFDSPDFWSRSGVEVLYYYKTSMYDGQSNYQSEWVNSKSDFPNAHKKSRTTRSSGVSGGNSNQDNKSAPTRGTRTPMTMD